jgi:hypothetical protein
MFLANLKVHPVGKLRDKWRSKNLPMPGFLDPQLIIEFPFYHQFLQGLDLAPLISRSFAPLFPTNYIRASERGNITDQVDHSSVRLVCWQRAFGGWEFYSVKPPLPKKGLQLGYLHGIRPRIEKRFRSRVIDCR